MNLYNDNNITLDFLPEYGNRYRIITSSDQVIYLTKPQINSIKIALNEESI